MDERRRAVQRAIWKVSHSISLWLLIFKALIDVNADVNRQVLAKLLKMEERVDWKACIQSETEDREDVQAFKTAFAPFDPSM